MTETPAALAVSTPGLALGGSFSSSLSQLLRKPPAHRLSGSKNLSVLEEVLYETDPKPHPRPPTSTLLREARSARGQEKVSLLEELGAGQPCPEVRGQRSELRTNRPSPQPPTPAPLPPSRELEAALPTSTERPSRGTEGRHTGCMSPPGGRGALGAPPEVRPSAQPPAGAPLLFQCF